MTDEERLRSVFASLGPVMDERVCRLWAAAEALALGRGGVTLVARATGVSRKRIHQGIRDLQEVTATTSPAAKPKQERVRRPGGGRRSRSEEDPDLVRELEALVEPTTRGDPMSPLRWTCKSTEKLATELKRRGHLVGARTVAALLKELGYSLQALQKTREGKVHPNRNEQFEHINAQVEGFQQRGQPVVSVDTKKKELVGDFKNGGSEWQPKGQPEPVRTHDFEDKELGKVAPYGVYDPTRNTGWVSVGTNHDTAAFAVQTLRTWWDQMGRMDYAGAEELLITADGGGSNGSRVRLWKAELQRFADETGLTIHVCHFPPGTSKWNKIEHRMFSHITLNWRGRPLVDHETIVQLIGSTTTRAGLIIRAGLDTGEYPKGIKVGDEEMASLNLERSDIHGEWNYKLLPRPGSAG